jgi:HrpA-like RNA helicase
MMNGNEKKRKFSKIEDESYKKIQEERKKLPIYDVKDYIMEEIKNNNWYFNKF